MRRLLCIILFAAILMPWHAAVAETTIVEHMAPSKLLNPLKHFTADFHYACTPTQHFQLHNGAFKPEPIAPHTRITFQAKPDHKKGVLSVKEGAAVTVSSHELFILEHMNADDDLSAASEDDARLHFRIKLIKSEKNKFGFQLSDGKETYSGFCHQSDNPDD